MKLCFMDPQAFNYPLFVIKLINTLSNYVFYISLYFTLNLKHFMAKLIHVKGNQTE